ncbi:MAG: HyaD/HybD family hydrogenase maturation endopeptidase [Gemmatimonadota bacterium]
MTSSTNRVGGLRVVGLGNVLCGDDGLGVAALRLLTERYTPPAGVQVLDGGTLGLSLLSHVADADALILLDAVAADAPPGTVLMLREDDVTDAARERLSVHQVGVADLFDALRLLGRCPPVLRLAGVVPATVELRVGLSEPVQAALPELVRRVVREAAAIGYPFSEGGNAKNPEFRAADDRVLLGL